MTLILPSTLWRFFLVVTAKVVLRKKTRNLPLFVRATLPKNFIYWGKGLRCTEAERDGENAKDFSAW